MSGELEVDHTGYPVIEGIRTKESDTATEEAVLAAVTKSALTATRKSTKYTKANFAAGFGTDVSFQTVDSAGVTTELGAIGMQHTGDGGSTADIVFKTWNGADTTGYTGDENGDYIRMRISSTGDVTFTGESVQGKQHKLEILADKCEVGCSPRITGLANLRTFSDTALSQTLSHVQISTPGSHNSFECGRRGKCNRKNGECSCFEGFTGSACGSLSALV